MVSDKSDSWPPQDGNSSTLKLLIVPLYLLLRIEFSMDWPFSRSIQLAYYLRPIVFDWGHLLREYYSHLSINGQFRSAFTSTEALVRFRYSSSNAHWHSSDHWKTVRSLVKFVRGRTNWRMTGYIFYRNHTCPRNGILLSHWLVVSSGLLPPRFSDPARSHPIIFDVPEKLLP